MKFNWKGKDWYIDGYLSSALNSIAYNLPKDWDIVLLITGDRSVRVGKSVLAMTVCAYLSYALDRLNHKARFELEDIYFDNKIMMDAAQKKPKYAINLYDEGREGLAASKSMKQFQQDLVDFFAECGQLNQVFVIVAPDFFELKETISVGRAEALINVFRKETKIESDMFHTGKLEPIVRFDRGYFEFFNRNSKRLLFDLSKSQRKKNYNLVKPNFTGRFTNQYPLDEAQYKQKKMDSLARFKERHENQVNDNYKQARNDYITQRHKEGASTSDIELELPRYFSFDKTPLSKRQIQHITHAYKEFTKENGPRNARTQSYEYILKKKGDIGNNTI